MFDTIISTQHGLIMDANKNVTNYDVLCAKLLTENTISDNKALVPYLHSTSEKYIKKIDDGYSVLADIAVDTDKITEFFTKIQFTSELEDMPLSTPLKNLNEVGRIKPEYLVQIAKDSATTINDIINNKITMKYLMNHFKSDISTRIKKQLVVSSTPVTDIKGYIKSQEKPTIVVMDSQSIMTLCIPFLRNFPVKKRELQEEIAAVKNSVNTVSSLMQSYTNTATSLKERGQINDSVVNTLNYYLYNQNRLMDELMTYMVFALITKIDAYTFNINSYMDLYKKTLKYNPEGSDVYHESVYEYSMATPDIDSCVNMAIYGNMSPLVDWTQRTYDSAKSYYDNHRTVDKVGEIDFILDQHIDDGYPYDDLFNSLHKMKEGLSTIRHKVKDQYASPEEIVKSAGFGESLLSRHGIMIAAITNIVKYLNSLNSGKAKSAVLFEILAEMRRSTNKVEEFGGLVKDVYDEINELIKFIERNYEQEIPNEVVRLETASLVKGIEKDFRNFLGVVIHNIIQRAKHLEDEVIVLVDALDEKIDATDVVPDSNLNILAVEACIELDDVFSDMMIEAEMIRFRNAKFLKEYGIVLEAEEPATNQQQAQKTTVQTPVNTQTQEPTNKKESSSPEVKVDESKQNDQDKAQNAEAASEVKKTSPESKKKISEKFKALIEKINGFFDKIIPDFLKGITSQLAPNNKFLEEYKDAVLGRSFNGVTLKIYNYFNLSSETILSDIHKVSSALGQINEKNLATYANAETLQQKLFSSLKLSKDLAFDDAMRIYYKVGPGQKEVKKVDISNTELKNRTIEMVNFCEDYYTNGGYKNVEKAINTLKSSLDNKVKSLQGADLNDEQLSALNNVSREVLVFSGAVLTGYRNRSQHYMYAIRKLVPRNAKPVDKKEEQTETAEQFQNTEVNETLTE